MSDAANQPKPLEIVSGVSGRNAKTRHSKSSTVSRKSASCVGNVGAPPTQLPYAGEKNRAPSRRSQALRAALHAAVEAFCDVMDAAEPERRPAARPVVVDANAPPRASDNAAANSALKRMGLR